MVNKYKRDILKSLTWPGWIYHKNIELRKVNS
jgi:hypothetical protein